MSMQSLAARKVALPRPPSVPESFRPVTLWVPPKALDRITEERGPGGFVGLVAELLSAHLAAKGGGR